MALVDAVVVSHRSGARLRRCVEPLLGHPAVRVIVVDNAPQESSLPVLADAPVTAVQLDENRGFGAGCNAGWRLGEAPFVLFLNPDAWLTPADLLRLVRMLERDTGAGAAAPKIVRLDGSLDHSLRRAPRLRSTYAQALFLHRLLPRAAWVDEVIREREAYEAPGRVEWASGACLLVRRSTLERLAGFDEGFFLYCEDTDLCVRMQALGQHVAFEPQAVAVHEGGTSAPRAELLPVLAASRVRFAAKHRGRAAALAERCGIALGTLVRLVAARGRDRRAGHARSLRPLLLSRARP